MKNRKNILQYCKLAKQEIKNNPFVSCYFSDVTFKTHVSLRRSLIINLIYIILNAISAVVYQTHWFAIFAIYYLILALMRFLLIRYEGRHAIGSDYIGELKRARLCAYILMTVNLALTGAVLMMLFMDRRFDYQGYLIYAVALYTFYSTTTAIIGIIKYRKYNSPIMSVSKIIHLAAALVSMLFLETAMFAQFGSATPKETQNLFIMLTGGGISIIVVVLSVYTIVHSSQKIRSLERSPR